MRRREPVAAVLSPRIIYLFYYIIDIFQNKAKQPCPVSIFLTVYRLRSIRILLSHRPFLPALANIKVLSRFLESLIKGKSGGQWRVSIKLCIGNFFIEKSPIGKFTPDLPPSSTQTNFECKASTKRRLTLLAVFSLIEDGEPELIAKNPRTKSPGIRSLLNRLTLQP